ISYGGVDRETWTVLLQTPDGLVPIDSVSQGMSAIFNWIGVLLQRLYDTYSNSPNPEREPAIVLIDEIDAHLHPSWQRQLVQLTKKHFPNVQVVATSHSPLLAGSVDHSQVRIVTRVDGKMSAVAPRENLEGQKAEDILTSSLFQMPTTRSPEAEETIKRYFEL